MRDQLMLLDRDPEVVGLACRPLEFVWRDGERVVAHPPHLTARRAGGERALVDCFGPGGLPRRLAYGEGVLRECAMEAGWQYRVEPAADPVLVGNVRWLSGYRHPRCAGEIHSDQVREVFAYPRSLTEGAAAARRCDPDAARRLSRPVERGAGCRAGPAAHRSHLGLVGRRESAVSGVRHAVEVGDQVRFAVRFPRDAGKGDSRSDGSHERSPDDACPEEVPAGVA